MFSIHRASKMRWLWFALAIPALMSCGKRSFTPTPDDSKAIQRAIKDDAVPPMLAYFQRGLDPNSKDANGTPYLILAAQAGDTDIVHTFLRYGAKPDIADAQGQTALMAAASHGFNDIVGVLLDRKADINRRDAGGATALEIALTKKNLAIAERLRQAGAKE